MKEEWKNVEGYEGYYMVSSEGRVKSLARRLRPKGALGKARSVVRFRILKGGGGPYKNVTLSKNNKQKSVRIHVLVWTSFRGNISKGLEINHKNGIKWDNRLLNLELVTRRQQMDHALKNGLIRTGERCSWSKLTEDQVLRIRHLYSTGLISQSKLADKFGVN